MKPKLHPESLMMSYGYDPHLSEGAIKCPIFQTSTFVFKSAEQGKAFFELAKGLRDPGEKEQLGLIYSRINNPDLEILEDRLCLWDGAEECAVFESGMSAITTVLLEFLSPGDLLLYSRPTYGGTDHFIHQYLLKMGVETLGFQQGLTRNELIDLVESSGKADRLAMIYIETPANPTNDLIDIEACREVADCFSRPERKVLMAVDNTYLGPLFQHPLCLGADLVIYSATKYIGGHSDVIAGAILGATDLMKRVKRLRTLLGNMAGPWTGWLLMRSLETLKIRMEQQAKNASIVAHYLNEHPGVVQVHYPGLLEPGTEQYEIFQRQCSGSGAMVSFRIAGTQREAFGFLNHLRLIKLAVSLGSTESLAEHPMSMTHAGIEPDELRQMGITPDLIRLSIGIEHVDDIIRDIEQALSAAPLRQTTRKLVSMEV